ncbi:MAG: TonB-dependent receptor, partial [Alphaproteobacteria bacterium]|nr:TonB-dependent receptor [Alphaproteobacteria bacterium]
PALGIFPPPFLTTNFAPGPSTNPPGVCPGDPFVGCVPIPRFPHGWVTANNSNPWTNDPDHAPGFTHRQTYNAVVTIDANLGFATLTVIPSYTLNKNTLLSNFLFGDLQGPLSAPTAANPSGNGYQTGSNTYKSVEARLASNSHGSWKYVFGLYYLNSAGNGLATQTAIATDQGGSYNQTNLPSPTNTLAAFGQVTYSLTSAFRLTGGLRYSRDEQQQAYTLSVTSAANVTTNLNGNFKNTQDAVQYKVGLEYDLAPESLLYVHVASGFKQGGINYTVPQVTFQPEHLTAYEIGIKNRFFDNRLTFNFDGFYYQYKNYQYSVPTDLPLGTSGQTASIFGVVSNAGPTHIYGLEAEWNFLPWRGGHFIGNATYLHARYGHACLAQNPFIATEAQDPRCTTGYPFALDGNQIQNSPDWSGMAGFNQDFNVLDGKVNAGVTMIWSSGQYLTPEQYLPGAFQDSYTVTNANLRYSSAGDHWSVGVFVDNIENKAQTTGLFPLYRRFVSPPRTWGLTTEFKF